MGTIPAVRWALLLPGAALFLVVTGARWWLIARFGSDLPFLDQWDAEARFLYKPYFENTLTPDAWFAPHNEHRIVLTRLLDIGLLLVNGQWDARLQMVVNAPLYAALATGLLVTLARARSPRFAAFCAVGLSIVFGLPFGWENTLAGFQSQFYFLAAFSLLAIYYLPNARSMSSQWWIGLLSAIAALLSMASGTLAAVAVLGLVVCAMLRNWPRPLEVHWEFRLTVAACALVALLGLALSTTVEEHTKNFQAHSLGQFAQALTGRLSWPVRDPGWWWLASWSPFGVFLFLYLKRKTADDRLERFILGAGLWVLLQATAIAFARASAAEASRYTDLLSFGLVVNAMCIALLLGRRSNPTTPALCAIALWLIVNGIGLYEASFAGDATIRKQIYEAQRLRTAAFVASGDLKQLMAPARVLDNPHPDPLVLAGLLKDPVIRPILPVSVRTSLPMQPVGGTPEAAHDAHGRFASIAAGVPFEYRVVKEVGLPFLFLNFSGNPENLSVKDSTGAVHGMQIISTSASGGWHSAAAYCPTARCTLSGAAMASGLVLREAKEIGALSVFAWVATQAGHYLLGIGILLMSLVLLRALSSR